MKINYKNLAIIIIFSVVWLFTGPTILNVFFDLEPTIRNFIPVVMLSIIGIAMFILKRHYEDEINNHQIDSLEMLIVIITPTVASFVLLPKDDLGRIFMPIFLVIVTMFWFIYFRFAIKEKEYKAEDKKQKEQEFVRQTKNSTLVIFLFLLALEIAVFIDVLSINKWMS